VEGNTHAALVQRSDRPARIDSYENVAGSFARSKTQKRGGVVVRGGQVKMKPDVVD
jgi:hypothetical protein